MLKQSGLEPDLLATGDERRPSSPVSNGQDGEGGVRGSSLSPSGSMPMKVEASAISQLNMASEVSVVRPSYAEVVARPWIKASNETG